MHGRRRISLLAQLLLSPALLAVLFLVLAAPPLFALRPALGLAPLSLDQTLTWAGERTLPAIFAELPLFAWAAAAVWTFACILSWQVHE